MAFNIGQMVRHAYNGSCPCVHCLRIRNKRETERLDAERRDRVLQQKAERRITVSVPIHWQRED